MADDTKKEKPKEKPAGWNFTPTESFIVLIFLLAIASTLAPAIQRYIASGELSFYGYKLSNITDFFKSHILFFKTLGFVIAFAGAWGTIVFNKKADAVWREEKAKLYPANMPVGISDVEQAPNNMSKRWEEIVAKAESLEPSNWRVAIIEADIILDELLEQLQLPGETMGDKLKAVEPSDFTTIESAWEAHKARNMIAHEGGNFLLSQRETRRLISLYGAVFKEFGLI